MATCLRLFTRDVAFSEVPADGDAGEEEDADAVGDSLSFRTRFRNQPRKPRALESSACRRMLLMNPTVALERTPNL